MRTLRTVPGLGVVEAAELSDYTAVEQYRGIPYGSISARFRQSKLVTSWPDNKWDGTNYGPVCPYPRFVLGGSIVQKPLKANHGYVMNEFKCLNLNITCPKGEVAPGGWPVVVWIHGGANVMSCGSEPQYDAAPLVSFSIQESQPIVMVTINYRLGILGFLASSVLKEDNAKAGDMGVGNYGIRDQLLAYEWIKKHIHAFGGDATRITAMGESAGSINTHIIMLSSLFASALPFSQAILQSGAAPLTVRNMKHQELVCNKISTHLKIDSLESLRQVPPADLFASYMVLGSALPSWQATVDGYFLSSLPKFSTLSQNVYHPSVKRILIGDCADEGILWVERLQKLQWTPSAIVKLAREVLGLEAADELLDTHSISANMETENLMKQLTRLLTNTEFSQPIEAVARSFAQGDVFYYHMREGNPFDGPKKGMKKFALPQISKLWPDDFATNPGTAHHAVDLLYPFLTYLPYLPAPLAALSYTVASRWITFINGGRPWVPYDRSKSADGKIMFFGPEGKSLELSEKEKDSYAALRVCERLQDGSSMFAAKIRGEFIVYD